MQYTLFEHGRPIGETDLGFARSVPRVRFGWFRPNALGETLMPVCGAIIHAVSALHQLEHGARGGPVPTDDDVRCSTEFADWREATHRLAQFELELRRPDGSVVPTEQISIQDTEALLELARHEPGAQGTPWDDDIDFVSLDEPCEEDIRMAADIEEDLAVVSEWLRERGLDDPTTFEEDEPAMGRYQICVTLLDDGAIP